MIGAQVAAYSARGHVVEVKAFTAGLKMLKNTTINARRSGDDGQAKLPLARVVSGGQTGVDRGALDAALELGFPCGGWCPPGRLAEDGCIPQHYPVQELASGGYRQRTIKNVLDSDGTLLIHFGGPEGGTSLTLQQCIRKGKPYVLLDGNATAVARACQIAAAFVAENSIVTLNVAGPRISRESRGHQYAYAVMIELLRVATDSAQSVSSPSEGG